MQLPTLNRNKEEHRVPNGGSDCCGTCWFNRRNQGKEGYPKDNLEEAPYCEIRDVVIPKPFYTYCANHPYRRPDRDPIPIGPIMRYVGFDLDDRVTWRRSHDTEGIRRHLLNLLEDLPGLCSNDNYPAGPTLVEIVIRQLGEFREQRAKERLVWISRNYSNHWADEARVALGRIATGLQYEDIWLTRERFTADSGADQS